MDRVSSRSSYKGISRERVKDVIKACGEFVRTRNIPECKKFISFYVKKVIVFKDKVRVVFKFDPDNVEDINGGERGIRTLGWVLAIIRFPVVRLRPAQPSLHV